MSGQDTWIIRCNHCGERSTLSSATAQAADDVLAELAAMQTVGVALSRVCEPEARLRVLRWACDRFQIREKPGAVETPIEELVGDSGDTTLTMEGVEEFFDPVPIASGPVAASVLVPDEPTVESMEGDRFRLRESPSPQAAIEEEDDADLTMEGVEEFYEPVEIASAPVPASVAAPDPILESVAAPDAVLESVAAPDPLLESVAAPEPILELVAVPDPIVESVWAPDPILKTVAAPDPIVESVWTPDPILKTVAAPDAIVESVWAPDPILRAVAAPDPVLESMVASDTFQFTESPPVQEPMGEVIEEAIGEEGDAAFTMEGFEELYQPVDIASAPVAASADPSLEAMVRGFVSDFQRIALECQPSDRRDDPQLIPG